MSEDKSPSIEEQVNSVLSNIGEDGKIPEGTDPVIAFAANAERRRRDTQSAYTKTSLEAKRLKAENDTLAQSWEQDAVSNLTVKEKTELEELKSQDPDAWRSRINEIESSKRTQFSEKRIEISNKASEVTELEAREQQLEEYNAANPEHQLTDEVIQNDIPPRITKKLASGQVSFGDFLEECQSFLSKGKVIKSPKPELEDDPNLDSVTGGRAPSEESNSKSFSAEYNDTIF